MVKSVSPSEFLWLMEHEKRGREAQARPKRRKKMVTRVKRSGCGSKKDDENLEKRGWTKVACGVWQKRVR